MAPTRFYQIVFAVFVILFTPLVWADETVCSDNGGTGWALPDAGAGDVPVLTSIVENFQFADVNVPIADINVDLDISHTWVGDLDVTVTSPSAIPVQMFDRPQDPAIALGCDGDDLNVIFDDEAATGTNIEALCGGGVPTISGTYQPHNIGTNPLSDLDAEQPDGNWTIDITDNATADIGTLNEVCLTVRSTMEFDKWVSTNATCSDTIDSLTVADGTTVYYCYTVTNYGTSAFTVTSAIDDQGIDISGLEGTYNPTNTVTVIQSVVAGTDTPIGLIINTATVTAGSMSTDETATLVVNSTPPTSGSKPMYLWANPTLSRTEPTAVQGTTNLNGGGNAATWTMTPTAYSDITIDSTAGNISVVLWLTRSGNPAANRDITVDLGTTGTTPTAIGTDTVTAALTTTASAVTFTVPIGADYVLAAGDALTLRITNATANGRHIQVYPWNNATDYSRVEYSANDVINVDLVTFYDAAYPGGNVISGTLPGTTIYIRSQISDPFGSFDITSANLTLYDNLGVPVATVTNVAMTEIIDSGTDTKTYEYSFAAPYTLPAAGADGTWRAEVTGYEGLELLVDHMGFGELIVGAPNLTILKLASGGGTAKPGSVITYSIIVSNTGTGLAENVELDDDVSAYTHLGLNTYGAGKVFQFVDGATASGLVMNLPSYSDNNRTDWLYNPSSGAGGAPAGYDGNVTDWRVPFLGSMQPGGSFTLNYQMQVK